MKRLALIVLAATVAIFNSNAWTQEEREPMNAQYASGPEEQARAAATIAAAVDAEISSGLFPGAVVLIGSKDAVLYHEAFGLARIEPDPVPMRKDSLFDIASMTKVVATATAIGILVDRGRIDPSAPMTRYLPDHQGRGASRISLRSLAARAALLSGKVCVSAPWFYHRFCIRRHFDTMDSV